MKRQQTWRVSAVVLLLARALQTSADALPDNILACFAEADAGRRLACYDREIGRALGQPAYHQAAAASVSAQGPSAEDQFGTDSMQGKRPLADGQAVLNQLTARVITISHLPRGELVLRLTNGQMWEQTEEGPELSIRVGDTVRIDKGALGAYWLSDHSRVHQIKVRRTH